METKTGTFSFSYTGLVGGRIPLNLELKTPRKSADTLVAAVFDVASASAGDSRVIQRVTLVQGSVLVTQ